MSSLRLGYFSIFGTFCITYNEGHPSNVTSGRHLLETFQIDARTRAIEIAHSVIPGQGSIMPDSTSVHVLLLLSSYFTSIKLKASLLTTSVQSKLIQIDEYININE